MRRRPSRPRAPRGLGLALAANTTYSFEYYILFTSAATNTGIGLALTGPATPTMISYSVNIPTSATDGTGALFSGWGTAYDDTVVGNNSPAVDTTHVARIHGVIRTGAAVGHALAAVPQRDTERASA